MHKKPLYSKKEVTRLMALSGLAFRKDKGQNFLVDGNIVDKISQEAQLSSEDTVIEIGPGLGAMTQDFLAQAGRVIALEIDRGFVQVLEDLFRKELDQGRLVLVNQDALKADFSKIIQNHGLGGPVKVLSNLPYYIASPLIAKILKSDVEFESFTLMVQEELADRMMAQVGDKDYGAFSLFIQAYGQARLCFKIPKTCFYPMPKVDSALVQILPLPVIPAGGREETVHLVRMAFQQRRKQAAKTVSQALGCKKAAVKKALRDLGLKDTVRPEEMDLEDFYQLNQKLKEGFD